MVSIGGMSKPTKGYRVALAIENDIPCNKVLGFLNHLRRFGFTNLFLLAKIKAPRPYPQIPDSSFFDQMMKSIEEEKAPPKTMIQNALIQEIRECPSFAKIISNFEPLDGPKMLEMWKRGLVNAGYECSKKILNRILTIFFLGDYSPENFAVWEGGYNPAGQKIEFSKGQNWGAIANKVFSVEKDSFFLFGN